MRALWTLLLAVFLGGTVRTAEISIVVDPSRELGPVRPLHGVNKGPLAAGSTIDLTAKLKELGIPFARLHDCQWPYPDVVDIHAIFRDFNASPANPASYDFVLTDQYIEAVGKTGAQIVYRLGESIEHAPVKRFVHPPPDPARWADVCLGIIRHYNEGWADGFRRRIVYWEIWNEPENRPAMWTGSDEQFLELYATAASRIDREFPELKVGGPGFGSLGEFNDGRIVPSVFVKKFLAMCRDKAVPLEFFSWHCYAANPAELAARARAVRKLLDEHGFAKTESHLNEWNYLPDNSWEAFSASASGETRRKFYRRMQSDEGAAFALAVLCLLQDALVDMANFFHGEIGGFGLFDEFGVPTRVYQAFREFQQFITVNPKRVHASSAGPIAVLAGRAEKQISVLLVNHSGHEHVANVSSGPERASVRLKPFQWSVLRFGKQPAH